MQFCYPISDVLVVVRRPSYTLYYGRHTHCMTTVVHLPLQRKARSKSRFSAYAMDVIGSSNWYYNCSRPTLLLGY